MNTKRLTKNRTSSAALLIAAALLLVCGAGCGSAAETAAEAAFSEEIPADAAALSGVKLDLAAPETAADGVAYADGVFLITEPGVYRLSGRTEDRVRVDAKGSVELVLDGVTLIGQSCLDIRSNDPVTITSAAGSVNTLSDEAPATSTEPSAESSGEASDSEDPDASKEPADAVEETDTAEAADDETEDASGAVVTSKAPLTFAGEGTIVLTASVNNGVRCKDDLTIAGGTLSVTAANDGMKAAGTLSVTDGRLDITTGGDGLQAEDARLAAGRVIVSGGATAIVAEDDGIRADTIAVTGGVLTLDTQGDGLQAETDLSVTGGTLSVTTGGGGGQAIEHPGESFGPWSRSSTVTETASTKGLKAGGGITIGGGDITLNTADDSVHCATLFTMDGGALTICSNDDAIHSDDMLVINNGTVYIDDCFEGLEAFAVEIRGGDVVIRAVNDGINANGSEMMFFRSSQQETTEVTSLSGASTTYVLLAGGRLDLAVTGSMQNQGDGIDSNGAVYVTGGEHVISTYGTFMENGLDTGWGGPVVTGGAVIAGGSSTMAEGFSSYSTQCAAVVATSYMPDGTEVVLSDAEGNVLWDVVLADAFSCIQISHPAMQVGQVYTLTCGGQSTTLDFTSSNLVQNTRGFGFPGGFR